MSYLLLQIFLCLLVAGMIGLLIGWFLNRLGCKKILSENNIRWERELSNISRKHNDIKSMFISKLDTTNSQYESKIKSIKDSHNVEIEAYKGKLSRAEANMEELGNELHKYVEEKSLMHDKYRAISKKLDDKIKENLELKKQIDNCKTLQDDFELKIKTLKEENESKTSYMQSLLSAKDKEFEHKLNSLNGTVNSEVDIYKSKYDKALESIKELEQQLANSKEESNKFNRELNNLYTELSKKDSEIKELKINIETENAKRLTEIEDTKKDINAYREKIVLLENEKIKLNNRINTLEKDKKELEKQTDEKIKELEDLQKKLDKSSVDYKEEIDKLLSDSESKQKEYNLELNRVIKELQDKNRRVEDLEDRLKKEIDNCNSKLSYLKNSDKEEISKYKEKILDLKSRLNSELNKKSDNEAEIQNLKLELEKIEDKHTTYQKQIKQLELETEKAKEANKILLEEKSTFKKEYDGKIVTLMSSNNKKIETPSKESSKIVADYTINVEKDKEQNVTLDGYVDSSREHDKIIQEANRLFGEQKVIDKIKILQGAPEKWSNTVILSLNNLYKLDYGKFNFINEKIEFKGYVLNEEIKDSITNDIRKYLPNLYSYKLDISILEKESKKDIIIEYDMVDRLRKRHVKGSQKRIKSKRSLMRAEKREKELKKSEELKLNKEPKKATKDNLQLIRGVGEVLEKTLNNIGVYRFEQIASWSDKEAEKIAKDIDFPGRIEREKWIEQAKKLAKGEKTEFSERVKRGEVPTSKDK